MRVVRAALGGPPLLVRLPVARAAELAPVAAQAGADALVIAAPPRVAAPTGDRDRHRPPVRPGLSAGRRWRRCAAVAALDLGLPLIGAGGIYSIEDAQTMLEAGAVGGSGGRRDLDAPANRGGASRRSWPT